eukprot:c25859_g1_i1 orf=722-2278(+)
MLEKAVLYSTRELDTIVKSRVTYKSDTPFGDMNLLESPGKSGSSVKQAKANHHDSDTLSFFQELSERAKLSERERDSKHLQAPDVLASAHTADSGKEAILDTCSLNLSVGLNRIRTCPVSSEDDPISTNHAITKSSTGGVFELLCTEPMLHASSVARSKWRQDGGLVLQDTHSKGGEQTATISPTGHRYGSGDINCCARSQFVGSQAQLKQGYDKKAKNISFHHALGLQNECCKGSDAKDTESSRVQFMQSSKGAPAGHKRKSFSHELGSRKSHPQVLPRAHSDNNLEDKLEALQLSFKTAKEEADMELALFAGDLVELLDTCTASLVAWREDVEDLLILARRCAIMPVCDFEKQCEGIVQELDDQRHELPPGFLKQLYTHILFILTRCTRLLQFQREAKTQEEGSFEKLQQCLKGIPSFERVWVEKKERPSCGTSEVLQHVAENCFKKQTCSFVKENYEIDGLDQICDKRQDVPGIDCSGLPKENLAPSHERLVLKNTEARSIEDEPCQLICRICEE